MNDSYLLNSIRARKIFGFAQRLNEIVDENVWYVRELCGCSRKHFLRVKYPWLSLKSIFSNEAIFGEIVHKGLENILKNCDSKYIEKKFRVNGKNIVLKGKIDALCNNVIYEFKTTRRILNKPIKSHEKQILIYMELLNIEKGYIIYINTITGKFMCFEIKKQKLDLESLLKAYIENCVEAEEWECNFCEYSLVCEFKKD